MTDTSHLSSRQLEVALDAKRTNDAGGDDMDVWVRQAGLAEADLDALLASGLLIPAPGDVPTHPGARVWALVANPHVPQEVWEGLEVLKTLKEAEEREAREPMAMSATVMKMMMEAVSNDLNDLAGTAVDARTKLNVAAKVLSAVGSQLSKTGKSDG